VNGAVDLVLEREESTDGVTIRGGEVVGADERISYKGKQGLRPYQGTRDGEAGLVAGCAESR
jgi:hypothetical protein